jgi:tRNA(Ile)-lysidine synthase TilS/MesJ
MTRMRKGIPYSQWTAEHRSTLQSLAGKRVFLLFSGGKDSSVSLNLISKASREFGFPFEVHAGAFPVHRYTNHEKSRIQGFWEGRGVKIQWHQLEETDTALAQATNPCLVCQKARKKMLHTLLNESVQEWGSLVIIASYTLWDIVSYSLEHMLGRVFSSRATKGTNSEGARFKETAQRFYPVLKMKEGYMVFRPLLRYNREDIVQALDQENIPTLSTPCRYKDFRPKRVLEGYFEKMGISFDYNRVLEFAKSALDLPEIATYEATDKEVYFKKLF